MKMRNPAVYESKNVPFSSWILIDDIASITGFECESLWHRFGVLYGHGESFDFVQNDLLKHQEISANRPPSIISGMYVSSSWGARIIELTDEGVVRVKRFICSRHGDAPRDYYSYTCLVCGSHAIYEFDVCYGEDGQTIRPLRHKYLGGDNRTHD